MLKGGLKREGASRSLNNNCIYPKCLIMEEDYILLETAKLLPENFPKVTDSGWIEQPTQALVLKWLRIVHNIHIVIIHDWHSKRFETHIEIMNSKEEDDDSCFLSGIDFGSNDMYSTVEEGTEEAIKYCLEKIIK